jgi:hypothetical protein
MAGISFTNGKLLFIEGDKSNQEEWWPANAWQFKEFINVYGFGTMKTMSYPNPRKETEPFEYNGFKYQFIIINDWNPCYIKNITTGKEREIRYIELGKIDNKNIKSSEISIHQ